MEEEKIILIGAGNVAHHLAAALLKARLGLCQIYSRSIASARELGIKTGITYTTDIQEIYPDGDIYIFCVSDDVLPSIVKHVRINKDALLIHTSGSKPMDILKCASSRYGVIYPIQTFSKKRNLDLREIPLCLEGCTPVVETQIEKLAQQLSDKLYMISSEQRKVLHLAAVFACNFPNFLYKIAFDLLEKNGLRFSMLRPLIEETAHKVMLMNPKEAQTGPARRGDESILNFHKAMLKEDKDLLKIYTLVSDMIKMTYTEVSASMKSETNKSVDGMPTLW